MEAKIQELKETMKEVEAKVKAETKALAEMKYHKKLTSPEQKKGLEAERIEQSTSAKKESEKEQQ